jgi:beta-glucosidase-like glycosyl hydrolase
VRPTRPKIETFRDGAGLAEGGPVTNPVANPETTVTTVTERAAWQDASRSDDARARSLLAALTLEEKIGQIGSRWAGNDMAGDTDRAEAEAETETETEHNVAPMQDVFAAAGNLPLAEAARHGLGHLTRVYGSVPVTPEEGTAELLRQHHTVLEASRLGIPALVHEECLTGFTTYGATVYPAAIAWAATWDPALVERMASAIGHDLAGLGVHQALSPVLDVVRDYRWGRVEETMGEDPYLVSMLGAAYVRGLEGRGVTATLKHFAGYSASRAARNHGPVSMGVREMRDIVLPPFETAIAMAGAGSVMNSYADLDGVPAGASDWLLTDVLRDEWGFDGTVVSDYWAVPFLASMHHVAEDAAHAGAVALRAGVDVELPDTVGFGEGLLDLVRRGEVSKDLVDRAAYRLLLHKVRLGLLDEDWTPESSLAATDEVDLDSPGNRAVAAEIAEKSVVLLDAGSALPLLGDDRPAPARVAVVGPCSDDPLTFMGCYAFPTHVLPRYPGRGLGIEVPSALAALRSELDGVELVHAPGCAVLGDDRSGFTAAIEAARDADVCIALVGDLAGLFGHGSSGEGCDAEDLRLPGVQQDLLDELLDTGTPVVVVVVSGRPYALEDVHGRAAGLVQAFFPGEEGGAAIAGVLSGRVCPGGKLPVQVPRRPGGQPSTYLQPALGSGRSTGITPVDTTPLFPFGYGGSYTSFEVGELRLSASEITTDGSVEAAVRVANTGRRPGDEVVQVYLHDPVAQVARPLDMLIGFVRVHLEPGEARDVEFTVHADRTAYTGPESQRIVEPGDLELRVGTSVAHTPCRARLRLTGPTRVVGHDRRLDTPTRTVPAAR